jgi:hypothetical protein
LPGEEQVLRWNDPAGKARTMMAKLPTLHFPEAVIMGRLPILSYNMIV